MRHLAETASDLDEPGPTAGPVDDEPSEEQPRDQTGGSAPCWEG